jgi:hypothetical protein
MICIAILGLISIYLNLMIVKRINRNRDRRKDLIKESLKILKELKDERIS